MREDCGGASFAFGRFVDIARDGGEFAVDVDLSAHEVDVFQGGPGGFAWSVATVQTNVVIHGGAASAMRRTSSRPRAVMLSATFLLIVGSLILTAGEWAILRLLTAASRIDTSSR